MFFKCKVCAEKEFRIADLKSQIQDLKAMFKVDNDPQRVPDIHMEADGLLSGQQHVIPELDSDEELSEAEQIRSERDRLLSGTY